MTTYDTKRLLTFLCVNSVYGTLYEPNDDNTLYKPSNDNKMPLLMTDSICWCGDIDHIELNSPETYRIVIMGLKTNIKRHGKNYYVYHDKKSGKFIVENESYKIIDVAVSITNIINNDITSAYPTTILVEEKNISNSTIDEALKIIIDLMTDEISNVLSALGDKEDDSK